MTIEQLKSKAYDIMREIERLQNELRQVHLDIYQEEQKNKKKES